MKYDTIVFVHHKFSMELKIASRVSVALLLPAAFCAKSSWPHDQTGAKFSTLGWGIPLGNADVVLADFALLKRSSSAAIFGSSRT